MQWSIGNEEFMERMTESTKAILDHFGGHACFINTMRNMSVDCDCDGVHGGKALIERMESRHAMRQQSYMKELGMGNDRYTLIDLDNGDAVITAADAVRDVKPGWEPDRFNTFWGRNRHR